MADIRYLNDRDYLMIITEEHLKMLLRDVHDRIIQAEQSAEMDFLEYLDQYYCVKEELAKGKMIREYSPDITYPSDIYFVHDDEIYRTLTPINGYKKPTVTKYWRLLSDLSSIRDIDRVPEYRQLGTYRIGDIVRFANSYYECVTRNGFDFGDIRIPGLRCWTQVPTVEWAQYTDYAQYDVVRYDGNFYILDTLEGFDSEANPIDSDCWSQIGNYVADISTYKYSVEDEDHDYVVMDGVVFKPIVNPNADELEEGRNIVKEDPRNKNMIKHLVRIATYYLHQTISPTNISETRRLMYEDSMDWLYKASKFKLNPQIPRRKDEKGLDKVDWAVASFERAFNPYENPWMI